MMNLTANLLVFFLLFFYPFQEEVYFQVAIYIGNLFELIICTLFFADNCHNYPFLIFLNSLFQAG